MGKKKKKQFYFIKKNCIDTWLLMWETKSEGGTKNWVCWKAVEIFFCSGWKEKKIEEAREGCKMKLYPVFLQFDGG